jgi:starch synthase
MLPESKPRVAYVRGSYLNAFEAQYLEPLLDRFDITAVYPRSYRYDVSSLRLPCIQLPCLDFVNGLVPRYIGAFGLPNPLKRWGYDECVFGLGRALAGMDLVHTAEQTFYCTYQVAKRKERYGYKLVVLQDEVNPFWAEGHGRTLERAAFVREKADLFIARSERARSALICEGVEPERIHVIGHGVDTRRFCPGPRPTELCRRFSIEPDHVVILFAGRLVWEKGLFSLADAAALLLQQESARKLKPLFVVAGDGPERDALGSRLRQLGISEHFRFIGSLPYSQLPDLHRLADLFVLPSIATRTVQEQFGIVLIEAMATGKPVLATRAGAIDEVVGTAGLLVQANDGHRLADALHELISQRELRERCGRDGLERVQRLFSHEVVGAGIAAAYATVLADASRQYRVDVSPTAVTELMRYPTASAYRSISRRSSRAPT